jgi:septal ring factor EnvC (AmiA/AmiB activator)
VLRLLALLLLTCPAWAAPDNKQKELGDLRGRIAELREEVERASEDRKEAADELRSSEKRISEVSRTLHDLGKDEERLGMTLSQLAAERDGIEEKLDADEEQLAGLLRQRYQRGEADPLRLMLSGANPGEVQRNLGYYAYVGEARAALIESHRANLDSLAAVEERTREKKNELAQVKQARQQQKARLDEEKQAHKAVYDNLSKQISQQRKEINSLVRDEQRLTRLIEKLRRLAEENKARKARELAAAKAREKLAREKQARETQSAKTRDPRGDKPVAKAEKPIRTEPVERIADASLADYKFASLRGRLALPTAGEIVAKFGQRRRGGGPAWKGLFIRARNGQPVRAVGSGEVVFSDWLRGFGNLLIVDHGSGYLSLYSNNESLYKQAGDAVRAGDVVAVTGNTGGHEEPGLYFELRRLGQPFDPMSWVR